MEQHKGTMINSDFKGSCYKPLGWYWEVICQTYKKRKKIFIYTHKILLSCLSIHVLHMYQVLAHILQSLAADDGERSTVAEQDQDWVLTRGSECRSVSWCCSGCREETCTFLHRNLPRNFPVARCSHSSLALQMRSRERYGEKGGRKMIMAWLTAPVIQGKYISYICMYMCVCMYVCTYIWITDCDSH